MTRTPAPIPGRLPAGKAADSLSTIAAPGANDLRREINAERFPCGVRKSVRAEDWPRSRRQSAAPIQRLRESPRRREPGLAALQDCPKMSQCELSTTCCARDAVGRC